MIRKSQSLTPPTVFASIHRILLVVENILDHLLTGLLHFLLVTNFITTFCSGPELPRLVIGQKARTVGALVGGIRSWWCLLNYCGSRCRALLAPRISGTPPTVFASIHRILLVFQNILDHVLTGLLFFLLLTNFITTFCSGPELPRLVIGQKARTDGTFSTGGSRSWLAPLCDSGSRRGSRSGSRSWLAPLFDSGSRSYFSAWLRTRLPARSSAAGRILAWLRTRLPARSSAGDLGGG